MDSQVVVNALLKVDPDFVDLSKAMLGEAVDGEEVWEYLYGLDRVVKMNPTSADFLPGAGKAVKGAVNALKTKRGRLIATGGVGSATLPVAMAVQSKRAKDASEDPDEVLTKADETTMTWIGSIEKADSARHEVFGYASVVEVDGEPIVDRQGDFISQQEIENAAYNFVLESRKGGHQHKRDEGDNPFHVSNMIESFVITDEKVEKMGLPANTPRGWWVGFKIHDDETWDKVEKGEVTGFSIHGKGKRVLVDEESL